MMFSFAAVGVLGASGMAIDMSRQSAATTALQSAIDGVALSVVKEVDTLTAAQLTAKAQAQFDALVANSALQGVIITVNYTTSPTRSLTVSTNSSIPSMFGGLFGIGSLAVAGSATIPISVKPAEIVLVLDNTGSMSSHNKMTELKKAATNLIDAMKSAAATSVNDITISLVPFATEVNIGTAASSSTWIDWNQNHVNKARWSGCVEDRDQPYDVNAGMPTIDPDTWYPASNCNLTQMMPLSSDWTALKARVAAMSASGNTNITIGLAWGMNMALPGAPLSAAHADTTKYNHYMVLLTDGMNTQNRFTSDSVAIDSRTLQACARAKALGIKVFTVRVIDGNANLLRSCASSPDMFYDVSEASQLSSVFDKIGTSVKSGMFLAR